MKKIDNFKAFVKKNPNLISHVHCGSMSWQKFYELYDLYGEEDNVWNDYLVKKEERQEDNDTGKKIVNSNTFSNILDIVKNMDTNKLQSGITSMQKAIGLFSEMLVKDKTETNTYTPRPIYRKFDD